MAGNRLNFAVIAAGEGSRLAEEGVSVSKPLVPISGEPMLGRLLSIFLSLNANCICIIINERMQDVAAFVEEWKSRHPGFDLKVCVRSTPSSMHSFFELSEMIPEGRFILTTVDTIFREKEFCSYARCFEEMSEGDGLFAVTRFVDDEKPLWITTDDSRIVEFSDTQGTFVSGGIYGLNTRTAFPVLRKCLSSGQSRMRNYQRALLSEGLVIRPYEFDKIMDVDHKADIVKAESFLCG